MAACLPPRPPPQAAARARTAHPRRPLPCRLPSPPCSGIDPAAQAFVTRFLLLTRATNLAYLASADPSLHDALEPLTDDQWNMLKGYLASLLPTYSSGTYSLFMAFGGAQIIAAEVQVREERRCR